VDGFDQDEHGRERDGGTEISRCLPAAWCDAFEPFQLTDHLPDAGAAFAERPGEAPRDVPSARPVRDDGDSAAVSRHGPVGVAVIALVAHHCAGRIIRPGVGQRGEDGRVGGLAAGQLKGDGKAVLICFQMDFRPEPVP